MTFKLRDAAASSIACSLCLFVAWVIVQPNLGYADHDADRDVLAYRAFVPFLHLGKYWIVVAALALAVSVFTLPRTVTAAVCALGFLGNLYLYVDSVVYALYRFHLDATIVPVLVQPDMGKDVFFSTAFLARAGSHMLALAGIHVAIYFAATRIGPRLGFGVAVAVATVWIGGGLYAQTAYAYAFLQRDTRLQTFTEALPFFRPSTLSSLTAWAGFEPPRTTRGLAALVERQSAPDGAHSFRYPLAPLNCGEPAPGPDGRPLNVVLVLVDTLRQDAATETVMPNLTRWARERDAFRFTDHLSGGSNTRGGMFPLFYGIPASYWESAIAAERQPVLMDGFLDNGYRFGIYVSSSLIRPPLDRTVFVQVPGVKLQADGDLPWQRDIAATDDFVDFVSAPDRRPFFSFLFYDAIHASSVIPGSEIRFQPFLEQIDYLKFGRDYDAEPYHNRYRQTAHQIDVQIGRVFDALDASGELDRTIVIVTSDHGQEFNDNGQNFWGHGSNFSRSQIHVPLFLFWPGRAGGDVTHRTSHHDVAPTLMRDLFGCAGDPSIHSIGTSLFSPPFAGERVTPLDTNGLAGFVEGSRVTVLHPVGGRRAHDLDTWQPLDDSARDEGFERELLDVRQRFLSLPPLARSQQPRPRRG